MITTNVTTKHLPSSNLANYKIRNKKKSHARHEGTVTQIFGYMLPCAEFCDKIVFLCKVGFTKVVVLIPKSERG
jgi:hypothetical protein